MSGNLGEKLPKSIGLSLSVQSKFGELSGDTPFSDVPFSVVVSGGRFLTSFAVSLK